MELESKLLNMMEQIGIRRGQAVLDFGCGYGAYTIPVAKVVGEQGRVYAVDKDEEALDLLAQRVKSEGLKNIDRMKTSEALRIGLIDESIDVVLLFDVLHSFYFPKVADRKRLLGEIARVMKFTAFLSISMWPNTTEPDTESEIESAGFYLEKELSECLNNNVNDFGTRKILNFRKKQYALSITNQSKRRQYGQSIGSYGP